MLFHYTEKNRREDRKREDRERETDTRARKTKKIVWMVLIFFFSHTHTHTHTPKININATLSTLPEKKRILIYSKPNHTTQKKTMPRSKMCSTVWKMAKRWNSGFVYTRSSFFFLLVNFILPLYIKHIYKRKRAKKLEGTISTVF